jgi:hypothetical protein
MAKWAQGLFTPKNAEKYVGKHAPRYRSGWELTFMNFCDNNKNVLYWASEALAVPYMNPMTGKRSNYIPDFFVVYQNKRGQKVAEVVEIKPKKQSLIESKMSQRDRAIVAVNYAKWNSATKWARRNGLTFRVINEDQIFHQGAKKTGK